MKKWLLLASLGVAGFIIRGKIHRAVKVWAPVGQFMMFDVEGPPSMTEPEVRAKLASFFSVQDVQSSSPGVFHVSAARNSSISPQSTLRVFGTTVSSPENGYIPRHLNGLKIVREKYAGEQTLQAVKGLG